MGLFSWLKGRDKSPRPSTWLPASPPVDQAAPPASAYQPANSITAAEAEWSPSGAGRQRLFDADDAAWGADWRMVGGLPAELVGEQHRKAACLSFAEGRRCRVEVEREPTNPHDANAIRVIGSWIDGQGAARREVLGYLGRDMAARLAETRPADMPFRAQPYRAFVRGDFVDLQIRLLEPSAASSFWSERGLKAPKGL